ncbi:hypothetical protein FSP39_005712 [Pinctada imbricata]|uniref:Small ribosomal subunit protein mS25 n=1 Tax=Pinctada imbricata TaxID=66713 RepID=A0AA88YQ10_PINIB|nr:hypothetical protein FSP39_005712 [Pinctada imbricata]
MPMMTGKAPIRRTLKYLEKGPLVLKEDLRVMLINWNTSQKASKGVGDFVFWHVPQIKYKNPDVEIMTFKNFTPSPWIQFINAHGDRITVDAYNQSKDDIMKHLVETFSDNAISESFQQEMHTKDSTKFGTPQDRRCMCVIPGQVPCPAFTLLPKELRGRVTPRSNPVKEDQ